MTSQSHALHRALLRPFIIHTLRAAGYHGARPAVIDTVTDLAERYLLLLAQTTARHADQSHNDPIPTVTDVRLALADCGALAPVLGGGEEEWRERMRRPLEIMGHDVENAGEEVVERRVAAEKRKRDDDDVCDIRAFTAWLDSAAYREIKRVAGLIPDASTTVAGPGVTAASGLPAAVGVGGGVVQAEDFLTRLKKKGKVGGGVAGDEGSRFVGTVLGDWAEDKKVVIEGGPVGCIADWKPKVVIRDSTTAGNDGAESSATASASGTPIHSTAVEV
ncbi:Hypothetical protein R9X50_00094400 [Acrodontium crateriforme]|uniref:Bromodomain associated domain-containing protein n=1 Tax=Acrodontium crateriforme TaxID=150365 RepID=A0AAQ3LY90_9PEZI|nr:Hypothetical protein R9X50_00094400 [Acrodontium crateriforme]